MRLSILLGMACLFFGAPVKRTLPAQTQRSDSNQSSATANPLPLQLEMRVPFEPTAFPSGQHVYIMYELHLTNFATTALSIRRIEVLDTHAQATAPIVAFSAEQLEAIVQPLGGKTLTDPSEKLVLAPGQSAIAFMSIAFDRSSPVPQRLMHRVTTVDGTAEGAVIGTHHTALHLLGPPVDGGDWLAADGPGNDEDNHHRRGVVILGGQALDSRRYAIDWKRLENGASSLGDARNVHSYFSYGQPVLAVADGRILTARDGLPDNIPGHGDAFHSSVPITLNTIAGNTITLDLGGGQFAYYLHLQPGSVRVKAGDYVHRGQVIARIGASGDAREPHLHFEVTTSSKLLMGEGIPYLIDRFRSRSTNDSPMELHIRELPLDNNVVLFSEDHSRRR